MRNVILSILLVCLLAGPVSAALFTLGESQLLSFDSPVYMDGFVEFDGATTDPVEYEMDMLGDVGLMGFVKRGYSMTVGATAEELGLTGGSYDGYQLFVANDNDDPWQVTLYVDGLESLASVNLLPGESGTLAWNFGEELTLAENTFIGLTLQSGISRTDYFHMSVSAVPVPAAVVIGMLGLGVAGLKLRKFV